MKYVKNKNKSRKYDIKFGSVNDRIGTHYEEASSIYGELCVNIDFTYFLPFVYFLFIKSCLNHFYSE